jgi:DNA modification methylase
LVGTGPTPRARRRALHRAAVQVVVFDGRGVGADVALIDLRLGDCLDVLRSLPSCSVQCCVTSPPYYGLRDYGVAGQIGLEPTPDAYVARMVEVFAEVRRVLRDDGTAWLNLGDSYVGSPPGCNGVSGSSTLAGIASAAYRQRLANGCGTQRDKSRVPGLKPKDLIGIPWRVAFAMQADGWWLRSDCIWAKPNPMPESVRDRPTKAHEYVFLLAKSERYFWDAEGVREKAKYAGKIVTLGDKSLSRGQATASGRAASGNGLARSVTVAEGRNLRTVWTITPRPFKDSHFATMPVELAERCIRAGSREGDVVLDPFSGAGTTGVACLRLGRSYLGIELNPEYLEMSRRRIDAERAKTPLLERA